MVVFSYRPTVIVRQMREFSDNFWLKFDEKYTILMHVVNFYNIRLVKLVYSEKLTFFSYHECLRNSTEKIINITS